MKVESITKIHDQIGFNLISSHDESKTNGTSGTSGISETSQCASPTKHVFILYSIVIPLWILIVISTRLVSKERPILSLIALGPLIIFTINALSDWDVIDENSYNPISSEIDGELITFFFIITGLIAIWIAKSKEQEKIGKNILYILVAEYVALVALILGVADLPGKTLCPLVDLHISFISNTIIVFMFAYVIYSLFNSDVSIVSF